jgi:hypothetical protein
MSRLLPPLVLLALAGMVACPPNTSTVEPGNGTAVEPEPDGGAQVEPGPDGGAQVEPGPDGGSTPAAGTCLSNADCNGGTCEGQGCGDDQPGKCVPADRMCTRDSRPYCGCDGQTFRGSGTCPGQRYAHAGECAPQGPTGGADGSACLAASDCTSGVCEGQGCGDDMPGECKPAARACTRDLRPYCGCDGQTFRSSGTCPGQRFASRGECTSASNGDGSKPKTKKGTVSDAKAP